MRRAVDVERAAPRRNSRGDGKRERPPRPLRPLSRADHSRLGLDRHLAAARSTFMKAKRAAQRGARSRQKVGRRAVRRSGSASGRSPSPDCSTRMSPSAPTEKTPGCRCGASGLFASVIRPTGGWSMTTKSLPRAGQSWRTKSGSCFCHSHLANAPHRKYSLTAAVSHRRSVFSHGASLRAAKTGGGAEPSNSRRSLPDDVPFALRLRSPAAVSLPPHRRHRPAAKTAGRTAAPSSIRWNVRVINIDVVVTDRKGKSDPRPQEGATSRSWRTEAGQGRSRTSTR